MKPLASILLGQRVDWLEKCMAPFQPLCFPFTGPGLYTITRFFLSAHTERTARRRWQAIHWIWQNVYWIRIAYCTFKSFLQYCGSKYICFFQQRISVNICLTSYCALLKFMKLAFDKPKHQTGLPHSRLSQQHQLELADLVAGIGPVGSCRSTPTCHNLDATVLLKRLRRGRVGFMGKLNSNDTSTEWQRQQREWLVTPVAACNSKIK